MNTTSRSLFWIILLTASVGACRLEGDPILPYDDEWTGTLTFNDGAALPFTLGIHMPLLERQEPEALTAVRDIFGELAVGESRFGSFGRASHNDWRETLTATDRLIAKHHRQFVALWLVHDPPPVEPTLDVRERRVAYGERYRTFLERLGGSVEGVGGRPLFAGEVTGDALEGIVLLATEADGSAMRRAASFRLQRHGVTQPVRVDILDVEVRDMIFRREIAGNHTAYTVLVK